MKKKYNCCQTIEEAMNCRNPDCELRKELFNKALKRMFIRRKIIKEVEDVMQK